MQSLMICRGAGNPFERAWITKYLLEDCEQEFICWKDLTAAFEGGNDAVVQPYMQPNTVYFTQLDAVKLRSWHIETLLKMTQKYNSSLGNFALVHLSDNQKNPHAPLYGPFYKEWKHVFRNYYWEDPVLLPLLADGTLSYFPLGYSSHMHQAGRRAAIYSKLPAQRTHAMTFLGNRKTGNGRRTANIEEISRVTGVNVTGQVTYAEFGVGSTKTYRNLMMNSKFCITVQGQFVECYRMYDALEVGCIVVLIDEYANWNYRGSHLEQLQPLLSFEWTDSSGERVGLVEKSSGGGAGAGTGVSWMKDDYTVTSTVTRVVSTNETAAATAATADADHTVTEERTVYETKTVVVPGTARTRQAASGEQSRRSSYIPFNNGGGPGGAAGVTIVPFVYMRSVAEWAEQLPLLLADEPMMQHLQRESSVWWRQVKEYYRREMTSKLCSVKPAI